MIKEHYIRELNLSGVLKKGSKGNDVKKVQEWLNLWRYNDKDWHYKVTVDEDFGPQTEAAVKAFQSKKGLTVDGIVGNETFHELTSPMIKAFSRIKGENNLRTLIVKYAEQHLKNNPRELYNNNQGPWVRAYMDNNEGKQWAWCMGFVQTILDQAFNTLNQSFTSIMPHTYSCDVVGEHGLAKDKLIRNIKLKENPQHIESGDVFLVVKQPHDWTHTGIVTGVSDGWIYTIEGNTNDEGVREGFEVCVRMRNFTTYNIDLFKVV